MKVYIKFPRNRIIDINNVPDNFEELICNDFKDFTEGTSKEYQYQDKLMYIDLLRKYTHNYKNADAGVHDLLHRKFDAALDEYGEILDKDGYYSFEFMCDCFNEGNMNLYDHYDNLYDIDFYISHFSDKVMTLIYRAIQAVINYEEN